ncbi:MAG: hypothetical protein JWO67_832 [Streptosporangiaceae bacterium]|nr:hypothetical protein [Streptosporangiaceae bacterium]
MKIVPTAGFEGFLGAETRKLELKLAADVADEAQRLAPVRSGTLRDSIHVEDGPDGVQVVASAPYAAYVELGTRHMPAEPFMVPALHERSA